MPETKADVKITGGDPPVDNWEFGDSKGAGKAVNGGGRVESVPTSDNGKAVKK